MKRKASPRQWLSRMSRSLSEDREVEHFTECGTHEQMPRDLKVNNIPADCQFLHCGKGIGYIERMEQKVRIKRCAGTSKRVL